MKEQEIKEKVENLQKIIEELEKKLQELQIRYEQLQTRDKFIDKQFKIQFNEIIPSSAFDAVYKIFKRRPKWFQRAWETNAVLLDLANRVITKNISKSGFPLPSECFEYLNSLNGMDNYSYASNLMDQIVWKSLCKIRRQKIESEFKVNFCNVSQDTKLNY